MVCNRNLRLWVHRRTWQKLRLDLWSSTLASTPECANHYFVRVEGVVDMARDLRQVYASKIGDASSRVDGAGPRENCQDSDSRFELGRKDLGMDPVLKPPGLLASYVSLCRCCESHTTPLQCDLSSVRISSASTSRPAATSASDWRSAS